MKKRSAAKSSWIFTLLVAGGVVLYAVGVFLPGQKLTAGIQQETHQHAKYIKLVDQQYLAHASIQESLQETHAHLARWRENAPQASQFSTFLGEITQAAADSNASLQRFTPQAAKNWETLFEHPLEAIVEGSFEEIHSFLQGLEKLAPTIWVENLAIQVIDQNEGKLRCELSLKVFSENLVRSD